MSDLYGTHITHLHTALYIYYDSHRGAGIFTSHFLPVAASSSKDNYTKLLVNPQLWLQINYKLISYQEFPTQNTIIYNV